jgi:hypothetical protein
METKADIIEAIVDLELEMFLSVPSDGQSECQKHPEGFKFHRRMQFSVWSEATLDGYRQDLMLACKNGENLMTVKYARMQGLLPCRNANPLIDELVRIKMAWQAEMLRRWPALLGSGRPLTGSEGDKPMTSFATYARGELETYSDGTLSSLYADMCAMLDRGINASEEIYRLQAEKSGFDSLEAAEIYMQEKNKTKEKQE